MSNLQERLDNFLRKALDKARDGLKLADIGELYTARIRQLVEEADRLEAKNGAEKKQWVLDQFAILYDEMVDAFPLAWWLKFIPGFMPRLRMLAISIAAGSIEAEYQRVKESRT